MGKKKPTVANGETNHDAKGRFTKGNSAGGNGYAGYKTKLWAQLYQCVTERDIAKIAEGQIRKAANGSTEAARFVFEYVLGKPAQDINLGGTLNVTDPRLEGITDGQLKALIAAAGGSLSKVSGGRTTRTDG